MVVDYNNTHDSLQEGQIASQNGMGDKNDEESMADTPSVCSTPDKEQQVRPFVKLLATQIYA